MVVLPSKEINTINGLIDRIFAYNPEADFNLLHRTKYSGLVLMIPLLGLQGLINLTLKCYLKVALLLVLLVDSMD